jgi:CBS-domain-containing membrane protein
MKVAELMQTDVRAAGLDWTLEDVVRSLADGHITALPVLDRQGRLVGVVSSADVLQAQAETPSAGTSAWRDVRVADVMNSPALTLPPDAEIRAAAQQMLYGEVHRLFVEEDGKLVGVISQTDLVQALAGRNR